MAGNTNGARQGEAGGRVQIAVSRGWHNGRFVARSGWRAARILCTDPANPSFLVAVTRGGTVWRMVNPSCVREARS